jgi:hypothetical protein
MSGIHRGTQYGYSLYEFEVYNDSADTFIPGGINESPAAFHLYNNYPNPFNPGTNIGFEIPQGGNVKLIVFNSLGQQICSLVDQNISAGTHQVIWNGKDSWGKEVPTGIYFYRLTSGGYSETKKMIFMK